jgi:hypothetical protein
VLEHPPITLPRFDLLLPITVRTAVQWGRNVYLVIYHPDVSGHPAAAVIDLRTGLAQIAYPFTVHGMPATGMDGVTAVPGTTTLIWWRSHEGAWGDTWNQALPWQPMPGFLFVP